VLQLSSATPAATAALGVRPEELVGCSFEECFPALRERRLPALLAEVAHTGIARSLDDAEPVSARVGHAAVFLEAFPLPGRSVGVTLESLPGGKQAQPRNETEESLAAALRSLGDAVVCTDLEGRVTFMNPGAARLTGWALPEAWHHPLADVVLLVDAERRQPAESPLQEVLRSGMGAPPSHRVLISRTGAEHFISERVSPIRDANDQLVGGVLILRDLSPQQRLLSGARRLEHDFRRVLDTIAESVAIWRGETFVYVNPAMAQKLGYDHPTELLDLPMGALFHPSEHKRAMKTAEAAARGDLPTDRTEWRFLRKDGSIAIMEWGAPQIVEFGGNPAFLVTGRDITGRRQLEAQLVLSDRLASVGTLAAGVAHEINNPLSYVMANLEIMAIELASMESRLPPEQVTEMRELLHVTVDGTERIGRIVRGLKTFARADEERRANLNVQRVLDVSINMVMNEVRHRARLSRRYSSVPLVHADEARLGQVFVNLIVNAAQSIAAGRVQDNEIEVSTGTAADGWAVVEIRDTGVGMSPDVQKRIFDPFFTTKPAGIGTGLGLSICHTLVSAVGGRIEVQSEPGHGTLVRVLLPPAQSVTPKVESVVAAPVSSPRRRILVIDDEEAIGASLRLALRSAHDVVTATSGRDALARLQTEPPVDLVICDMMMPQMTGIDVHDELARTMPHYVSRLVFMTGGAFTPATNAFLEKIPDRVIEKPIEIKDLKAVIERLTRDLPPVR
jgi:PAS domain S-box-containing protein